MIKLSTIIPIPKDFLEDCNYDAWTELKKEIAKTRIESMTLLRKENNLGLLCETISKGGYEYHIAEFYDNDDSIKKILYSYGRLSKVARKFNKLLNQKGK